MGARWRLLPVGATSEGERVTWELAALDGNRATLHGTWADQMRSHGDRATEWSQSESRDDLAATIDLATFTIDATLRRDGSGRWSNSIAGGSWDRNDETTVTLH